MTPRDAVALVAVGLGVPRRAVRLIWHDDEWSVEVRDRSSARATRTRWTSGGDGKADVGAAAREAVEFLTHMRSEGLFFGPVTEHDAAELAERLKKQAAKKQASLVARVKAESRAELLRAHDPLDDDEENAE